MRIVEFWATWCKPCLPAMQALLDIALRHPEVDVFMVSIEEDLEAVRRFAAEHEVPGVIAVLAPPPAQRPSVRSVPMVVVLDRAGHVVKLDYIGMIEAHVARAKQSPPTCHPTPLRPEHAAPHEP